MINLENQNGRKIYAISLTEFKNHASIWVHYENPETKYIDDKPEQIRYLENPKDAFNDYVELRKMFYGEID